MTDHEQYIHSIRALVVSGVTDAEPTGPSSSLEARRLQDTKLLYGIGAPNIRGITYYDRWQNGHRRDLIEISASAEESGVQLAGTTIHELAHILSQGNGHGHQWKAQCARLGLLHPKASGQCYTIDSFVPAIRDHVKESLPDGMPVEPAMTGRAINPPAHRGTCRAGQGARGGTSRGTGSGSRMRRYTCSCAKPIIIRTATDDLDATCNKCQSAFTR